MTPYLELSLTLAFGLCIPLWYTNDLHMLNSNLLWTGGLAMVLQVIFLPLDSPPLFSVAYQLKMTACANDDP